MYRIEIKTRIRYGETDKMGYVYHGNYPVFYDMARTEMIRSIGLSYKELEDSGVMMPVLDLNVKYKKAVFYDELITITATLKEFPDTRMRFYYEIFNEKMQLANLGETTLVFVDALSRRPMRVPEILAEPLRKVFVTDAVFESVIDRA